VSLTLHTYQIVLQRFPALRDYHFLSNLVIGPANLEIPSINLLYYPAIPRNLHIFVESLGGNEHLLGSHVACYIGVGKTPTVVVHMCTIRVEYYSIPCSTYYID
jgi:hypothetical protein